MLFSEHDLQYLPPPPINLHIDRGHHLEKQRNTSPLKSLFDSSQLSGSINVQDGRTMSFLKTIYGSRSKIRLLCRLPPKGTSPFPLQGKNLYAKDELTCNNIHCRDVTCTHLSLCFAVLLEVAAVLIYLSVLLEDWLITSRLLHTLFFITYGFL